MATRTVPDLSKILTSELFKAALENRLPWRRDRELDFPHLGPYWWHATPEVTLNFQRICTPALRALSKLDLLSVPEEDRDILQQCLPDPSSTEFPEQALGCIFVLDQAPRTLSGTDQRWCYSYFDVLSLGLARQLLALPPHLSPFSKARWTVELGATFGYWVVTRMWFTAPICHSESLVDHEVCHVLTEKVRKETESYTGTVDPNRANFAELLKDEFAYARWLPDGPTHGPGTRLEDFAYWYCIMMEVHKAIIDKYGRYPERNVPKGRQTRRDEVYYLENTKPYFKQTDPAIAKQLREDVLTGKWTSFRGVNQ